MKKLLYTMLLLTFQSALGMERDQMTPINTWQDVIPFVGVIVVFTSKKFYFNKGALENGSYEAGQDPKLKVGYISKQGPTKWASYNDEDPLGYEMFRLIKKDGGGSRCALNNSQLQAADLKMRPANLSERVKIAKAVEEGKAKLDFMECGGPDMQGFELDLRHALMLENLRVKRLLAASSESESMQDFHENPL